MKNKTDIPRPDPIHAIFKIANDTNNDFKCRIRAIYVAALLKILGIESIILNITTTLSDDKLMEMKKDESLLNLNGAIGTLKLQVATDFLCRQLDIHLQFPNDVSYFGSTIWILEDVDSDRAAEYWDKMGLSKGLHKHISHWNTLNYADLKDEVKKVISGRGLGGMAAGNAYVDFVPKYYAKIKDNATKERINKILFDLIDDYENGYASGAIYISSTLRMKGIKEKLLSCIDNIDSFLKYIFETSNIQDRKFNILIQYLSTLNMAIGKLEISEAKEYLIKQIQPLRNKPPQPLTKEHIFYYVCAK